MLSYKISINLFRRWSLYVQGAYFYGGCNENVLWLLIKGTRGEVFIELNCSSRANTLLDYKANQSSPFTG